jgi:hypothetical protein
MNSRTGPKMTEASASLPWRRIAIREVMGLIALVAIACVWPGLIPTEVLGVLFWVSARRYKAGARERLVSYGLVVAAVYVVPVANFWLATVLHPALHGPEWRAYWSPWFPVTPGVLQAWIVASRWHGDVALYVDASVLTAGWVWLLTLLAGRSRIRRIVVAVSGLLCSALATWLVTVVNFLIPT